MKGAKDKMKGKKIIIISIIIHILSIGIIYNFIKKDYYKWIIMLLLNL